MPNMFWLDTFVQSAKFLQRKESLQLSCFILRTKIVWHIENFWPINVLVEDQARISLRDVGRQEIPALDWMRPVPADVQERLKSLKYKIQSSGSIGVRPIGGTLPFVEKNISGSIGGTLKMTDYQIF